MAEVRKLAFAVVLLWVVVPLACAQDAVTTVQLPDGRTSQLTFTTIDVPGAGFTTVTGINAAGDMVGYYGKNSNGPYHGFLLSGGKFTFFDYPGAASTVVGKINDAGLIVGNTNGGPRERGFSYDGTNFTSIRHGKDAVTVPIGINSAGYIVGGAGMGDTRAFELRGTQFKMINFPGLYFNGYGTGINKFGQVAGWTTDGTNTHGYEYSQGTFTQIDFPGADMTEAWDINDSGVIVGWYQQGASFYGFALINGQFTSFGYPGVRATFADGINASGQIVGTYTDDFNTYHGFVTSQITEAH
jgi:hypothetical protein